MTKKCKSCGNTNIVTDHSKGERYCGKCGLVLEENMFDFGPEWRAFDMEQADKRSRTGGLLKYAKLTQGLTTEINKYDTDIKGRAIPAERKAKFYRLRKWQKRSRMATSLQRNLSVALPELDRMCSYLNIAEQTKEACARLYRKCAREGIVRGRSIEGMVAAVIYLISREHRSPVILNELEAVSGVSKKEISKSYKKIAHQMELKIPQTSAVDYVPRIASKLNASGETTAKAIKIVKTASEMGITTGRVPISIAAAAVYLAGELSNDEGMKKTVKDFYGTSKNSIKERMDEFREKVIKDLD